MDHDDYKYNGKDLIAAGYQYTKDLKDGTFYEKLCEHYLGDYGWHQLLICIEALSQIPEEERTQDDYEDLMEVFEMLRDKERKDKRGTIH